MPLSLRDPNSALRTFSRPSDAKQRQLLHVLPDQLGWDDQERRGWLELNYPGKSSSKDLTYREATLAIDKLQAMVRGEKLPTARSDGATKGELYYAARLRGELGEARFDGLARRIARLDPRRPVDLGTLSGRHIRAVIQATKSILTRSRGDRGEKRRTPELQPQEAPFSADSAPPRDTEPF